MIRFFENLYYNPKWYHYIVALILLPLSIIYGLIGFIKYLISNPKDFRVKIISIGNLVVGGSGKTPIAIEIIKYFIKNKNLKICYISRGYGRDSKGLVWVKKDGNILVDTKSSGDEAMLVAKETKCDVIVSEDREYAINEAKKRGVDLIVLDDAFSKVSIKKLDILLEPNKLPNKLTLPSGPFREFWFAKSRADIILKEDRDFKREVKIINPTSRMLLVTAIANPNRLEPFLPKEIVGKFILKDHSFFDKDKIIKQMRQFNATSILVTKKDMVKLENFNFDISIMDLEISINKEIIKKIEEYYER